MPPVPFEVDLGRLFATGRRPAAGTIERFGVVRVLTTGTADRFGPRWRHLLASELTRLVAGALRVPEQQAEIPGLRFEDLPTWDSMARIELVVSLEDRYGIELSQAEIAALAGMDEIRALLAARGQPLDEPR